MTAKIKLLSEHTINRIAAGEVIENPASLVKELVENSLDAGAAKIVIEVFAGGLQKIKISDDGSGMGPDDALLSLERHATSKITDPDDLFEVSTMGFRGEALASIASISKMTLQTADASGVGTEVETEAGKILRVAPFARVRGTTIEVRQLFFNVPARKKFQKSSSLCLADVTKAIVGLALAHPFVAFELYDGEARELKVTKPSCDTLLEAIKIRAKELLGQEFLTDSVEVEGSFDSFSFTGLLGSHQNTRPNRSLQYQFINKRHVSCPAVSFAIKDAFGTRIEEKRFPIYVLHLDIPKEFVDVNVHPQKKEIRLKEETGFKENLRKKIEETFTIRAGPLSSTTSSFNLFSEKSFFTDPAPRHYDVPVQMQSPEKSEQLEFSFEQRPEVIGVYDDLLWIDASTVNLEGVGKEGILWVDLKKAASRILFDSLYTEEKPREKQMLFLPLTLDCTVDEEARIEAMSEEVEKMGFCLQKNRNGFLIEAIPPSFGELEALEFLKDYLCLEERNSFSQYAKDKKLAATCAKLAGMRKPRYSEMSALSVFKTLLKTSSPSVCPLGGKIITFSGKNDLQKLFFAK